MLLSANFDGDSLYGEHRSYPAPKIPVYTSRMRPSLFREYLSYFDLPTASVTKIKNMSKRRQKIYIKNLGLNYDSKIKGFK